MKNLLLLFLVISSSVFSQTKPLQLKGQIGTYKIELEISSRDYVTGELTGKYNYKGKTNHLNLKGQTYNGIFVLEESYKGEHTGTFYLETEADKVVGKWIQNETWYDVELKRTSGDWDMIHSKSLDEYQMEVNDDLSGVYATENYFINDMWFREDHPEIEIGYNGGALIIEPIHKDSLRFHIQLICGPTYHFATASGIAVRNDSCFLYTNEEGCEISIRTLLNNRTVHIKANGSMECGFGARAYMDHSLIKVTNEIPEGEEPNLNVLLGREPQRK